MAEKIGIGGILTFDNAQALTAISKTKRTFVELSKKVDKTSTSMGKMGRTFERASQKIGTAAGRMTQSVTQVGTAVTRLGAALAPLSIAMGLGFNQAAKFEQQMSNVGSIVRGTAEEMKLLEDRARKAGIETAFSATEAANAMEFMARAGAESTEIIDGLAGVLNAAAADSIPLATASNIIAQTTRIMGREWADAQQTADVLVRTSQLTNTNMIQLGQAFRYGGQSARRAGITFAQTSGILGQLANAGLSGSMGGTSLANALRQLANPSDKAAELIRKLNITMTTNKDGTLDFVDVIDQFIGKMREVPNALERVKQASIIFGARGGRAFGALAEASTESTKKLIANLEYASAGIGAAAEAAETRLDNFLGAMRLFKSSLEGLAITIFKPMLPMFKEMTQANTRWLNNTLEGVKKIMDAGDNLALRNKAIAKLMKTNGAKTTNIMLGVVDAVEAIIAGVKWLRTETLKLFDKLQSTFGPETTRTITKFVVIFAILGAVLAPIIIVLGTIIGTIGTLGSVIVASFTGLIGGLFWPLLIILGALGVAFAYFYETGDTAGETLTSIWDAAVIGAGEAYTALTDFVNGFKDELPVAIDRAKGSWAVFSEDFKTSIDTMIDQLRLFVTENDMTWEKTGSTASRTLGWISLTAGFVATSIVNAFTWVGRRIALLFRYLANEFKQWKTFISNTVGLLVQGIVSNFQGSKGMPQIYRSIYNMVLEPLKAISRWIIAFNDTIGGTTSPEMREWSRSISAAPQSQGQRDRGFIGTTTPTDPNAPPVPQQDNWEDFGVQPTDDSNVTRHITEVAASATRGRNKPPPPPAVKVALEDTRTINVNNEVCVDGQQLAVATQRHRTEIGERSGFRGVNWNRRLRVEQGALPAEG